ncbi:MAG TPA: transposase [Dissulfurispiraceae bacterium]|nr:transposase [Dissulfurispiraceae bacterium]
MGTKKGRRSHSREFKGDAVRLVTNKGIAVSQLALELGVHENTIYKWLRQYQADPAGAFPGKGHLKPSDEVLRRLQRENVT